MHFWFMLCSQPQTLFFYYKVPFYLVAYHTLIATYIVIAFLIQSKIR